MIKKQTSLLRLCFSVVLLLSTMTAFAGNISLATPEYGTQQASDKQVSGRVLDENGDPVIGATVTVKGTQTATVTDVDGNFSFKVPSGSTLVISYLGYSPKEVAANGTNLTIKMSQDSQTLNEVVVTALGIKKEAKSLSYNVQQLNNDAVTKVQDANFVNSLNGKVAGVQFSQSAAGVGAQTRVVMRGVKSINGNSNVLYVIDGVPMPNIQSSQPADMYSGSGSTGDAAANINPNDIESISVLSGPSAAALYGSDAANGVILITTKKGQQGRLDVTYSGSFQFSRPFVTHKFQNTYGTSSAGSFDSWGSKLTTPSSYDPNDFFQTGTNFANNVSVSTGNDKNQTYLSLGSTNATGLIHNNNYDRYNVSVRNTSKFLDDKLTLDLNYTLSSIKEQNMISQGQYHNPLYTLYLFPAGGDWQGIQYYSRQNLSRNLETQYWPWLDQNELMENPYWIAEKERFINHKTRNMLNASLKWDITSWISLTGRVKYDNSDDRYEQKFAAGTKTLFASDTGYYSLRNLNARQLYAEAFATINKYFDQERWSLTAVLGANYDQRNTKSEFVGGNLSKVPNSFTLNNIDPSDPKFKMNQEYSERREKEAVYASAQLGYRSMAYIDLTARNDWSSALYPADDSYFYWSAGISGIWTDIFPQIKSNNWLNYFKTRISYSEVGNDPSQTYLTIPTYTINGATGPSLSTSKKNPNLDPELTKSWEAGFDFVLFRNRLKVNATLYRSSTYNQFFNIQLDPSSGYTNWWVNGGRVDNKGVELSAHYNQPLGPVQWESYLTWTLNRNKVKEVINKVTDPETNEVYTLDEMNLGGFNGTRNKIVKGGNLTDIYVRTLSTGEHGEIYVDPQDHSVRVNANDYVLAGHATPNYTLSWGNNFSWKGFNFGFLFNYRNGGVVVSLTESLMDAYGTSVATAQARDNGGVVINGVNGITPQGYYQTISSTTTTIASQYVYSATNLRLSELTFGYDVPITKVVPCIKGMSLSFVAHNLWMLYCRAPFDPELTANTGTYNQGIDYFMQPSSRSMGFSVKVKF
ncbi:MAG: SusC/RagA family TonB-linked outer membrane protein [Prevotella sp.]|nr:SusC/RagA family TonB-linked outer membrane protein [Prevotella sp.]MCI1282333.1 SusC/RagA family TonB-linked outer membrane protein [Prevotella sp.]